MKTIFLSLKVEDWNLKKNWKKISQLYLTFKKSWRFFLKFFWPSYNIWTWWNNFNTLCSNYIHMYIKGNSPGILRLRCSRFFLLLLEFIHDYKWVCNKGFVLSLDSCQRPLFPTIWTNTLGLTIVIFISTLHWFTCRHTGCHMGTKLHYFTGWELERIKVGKQNLAYNSKRKYIIINSLIGFACFNIREWTKDKKWKLEYIWRISIGNFPGSCWIWALQMVFCFQNCSSDRGKHLNFWNSWLKAENLQIFWDH